MLKKILCWNILQFLTSTFNNEKQIEAANNFNPPDATIIYNFNELPTGSNWNQIAYPHATFGCFTSTTRIATVSTPGREYPNWMVCTSPYGFNNPGANFTNNVHNLSFSVTGGDGGTFKVDLFRNNNAFDRTLTFNASCGGPLACFVDLRSYTNVSRIAIHSINDPYGLGFDDFSFNLGGSPPPPPPPTNQPPVGYLDGVGTDGIAWGWTRDPDNLNAALQTHLYIDCPAGPSCNGSVVIANVYRADVGSHGFNFTIPAQFRDGQPHTIYAYGIDSAGGANTLLTGSPKTFTLPRPNIQSVTFEAVVDCSVAGTNGCLSPNPGNGNPNTNIGERIFPDKATPTETVFREKVRVKAIIGQPDVMVYFRNYDPDDPSSDDAPVDSNASSGNDNRISGGSPLAGWLVCPPTAPSSVCTRPAEGRVSAKTDASGVATAELTVSIQPGNNFIVSASADEAYVNGVVVAGTQLFDSAGNVIPEGFSTTGSKAKRTSLLTVWRKLYLEVDSMGAVVNNSVVGSLPSAGALSTKSTRGSDVITVTTTATPLEVNRFEKGRLKVGADSYEILRNSATTVTVNVITGGNYPVNTAFELFDDDNFDLFRVHDWSILNGDNGEDIPSPPLDFLQANDDPFCDDGSCNIFAKAYVRPSYEFIGGDTNIPFVAEMTEADLTTLPQAKFDLYSYHN